MFTDNISPIPLIIDESYTCVCCGKNNLEFEEIAWIEDEEGQIDMSTVKCMKCWMTLVYSHLEFGFTPEQEKEKKEIEQIMMKYLKKFDYNYSRITVRRATIDK